MAYFETVQGRGKFIIFLMVDDIKFEDLPEVLQTFIKSRTYIEAFNIDDPNELDLFRNKLQYAMPPIPLQKVPREEANPEQGNPMFPPQFNRLNTYQDYNRRMRQRRAMEVREWEDMEEEEEDVL